jgi:hypothetical protein
MLAIVSDLHLTDNTATASLPAGGVHLMIQQLRDMAERASWRADGSYRPLDRLDLVLLGDVLDITSSTRWLSSGTRPWMASLEARLQSTSEIVDDILKQNQANLQLIRSMASDGIITVPGRANRPGEVLAEEVPVAVRIFYMVGNRDWPLHQTGPAADVIRQRVAHHLGLTNSHNRPFPHDASEDEQLLDCLRRHRLYARHGDIFDPLSFSGDRDMASVTDAICIELLIGFTQELHRQMDGQLSPLVLQQIGEVQHVRPLLLSGVYLDGLLRRVVPSATLRKQIQRLWDDSVQRLLAVPVITMHDGAQAMNLIDGLDSCLSLRRKAASGWIEHIQAWSAQIRGAAGESLARHALMEADFRNRRARHIVYGHTHLHEQVPLDASHADGFVLNQMYFNAGTLRRGYRSTYTANGLHEFIPSECLTLLAFYQEDERAGRPFESISGSLGVTSNSIPQGRGVPTTDGTGQRMSVPTPAASHINWGEPAWSGAATLL